MNAVQHTNAQSRWSLLRGRVLLRVLRADPTQEYLVYVPHTGAAGLPVFASVHGVSRNAYEQARVFAPLCEQFGAVLIVPRFTHDQHRDYQRLGRGALRVRADTVLHQCLAEVASLTGADATQILLFGYSGGAQFAHRYLMAHPHRVARAVVAAAGWYTFPDHRRRFPYGIRSTHSLPGVNFNPEEFLHVPVDVLVGARDVGLANLRSTERLDRQQGRTRVDRARNWVAAMQAAADAYDIESAVTFTEVPDVDHSFKRFCQRGALVERVFSSLFGVGLEQPQGGSENGRYNGTDLGDGMMTFESL